MKKLYLSSFMFCLYAFVASSSAMMAVGTDHACVLKGGSVYCWGGNPNGQLGNGEIERRFGVKVQPWDKVQVRIRGRVTKLTSKFVHTCALNSRGEVYCWGYNANGQLGVGDREDHPLATKVNLPERVVDVSAGFANTCAVTDSGRVFCWGMGAWGALGTGVVDAPYNPPTKTDSLVPVEPVLDGKVLSVRVGSGHVCVNYVPFGRANTQMICWGSNPSGALGNGRLDSYNRMSYSTTPSLSTPINFEGQEVLAFDAGGMHTCAVLENKTLECWGSTAHGEGGLGCDANPLNEMKCETLNLLEPTHQPVLFPSRRGRYEARKVRQVVTGRLDVTCALDTQGDVYCWGGTYKDFATGTTILPFVNRPTKVDLPARISFIAMSGERVCAMAGPSRVWCWGKNFGSSPQEIKFQKPRVY